MDFMLTNYGDLVLEKHNTGVDIENHIAYVEYDKMRNQIAMCRILSVTHDWFYDNIGSDLEQIIGEPVTQATLKLGKELIINALTKNEFASIDEIQIEDILVNANSVGYNVYLRQRSDSNTYIMFKVTLDLVKGVTVTLEGDVDVNIK